MYLLLLYYTDGNKLRKATQENSFTWSKYDKIDIDCEWISVIY